MRTQHRVDIDSAGNGYVLIDKDHFWDYVITITQKTYTTVTPDKLKRIELCTRWGYQVVEFTIYAKSPEGAGTYIVMESLDDFKRHVTLALIGSEKDELATITSDMYEVEAIMHGIRSYSDGPAQWVVVCIKSPLLRKCAKEGVPAFYVPTPIPNNGVAVPIDMYKLRRFLKYKILEECGSAGRPAFLRHLRLDRDKSTNCSTIDMAVAVDILGESLDYELALPMEEFKSLMTPRLVTSALGDEGGWVMDQVGHDMSDVESVMLLNLSHWDHLEQWVVVVIIAHETATLACGRAPVRAHP